MGSSHSKTVLTDANLCSDLSKSIQHTQLVPSNSESPTLLLFCTVPSTVGFVPAKTGISPLRGYEEVVLKIAIRPASLLAVYGRDKPLPSVFWSCCGIAYEQWVYEYTIVPLIALGVCTGFVQYLVGSSKCPQNLVQTLGRTSPEIREYTRRLCYPDLKMFTESVRSASEQTLDYVVMVMERETTDFPLSMWWFNHVQRPNDSVGMFIRLFDAMSVLFQISFILASLEAVCVTHFDLHLNNILIIPTSPSRRWISATIGSTTVRFPTNWIVKVFDFDRAIVDGHSNPFANDVYQHPSRSNDIYQRYGMSHHRVNLDWFYLFRSLFSTTTTNIPSSRTDVYANIFRFCMDVVLTPAALPRKMQTVAELFDPKIHYDPTWCQRYLHSPLSIATIFLQTMRVMVTRMPPPAELDADVPSSDRIHTLGRLPAHNVIQSIVRDRIPFFPTLEIPADTLFPSNQTCLLNTNYNRKRLEQHDQLFPRQKV